MVYRTFELLLWIVQNGYEGLLLHIIEKNKNSRKDLAHQKTLARVIHYEFVGKCNWGRSGTFPVSFACNWTPIKRRILWNHFCLSICLSVCPSTGFLENCSFVFSDFLHQVRSLKYLKTDRARFFKKIQFCPNLGKKGPKWPKIGSFVFF